MGIIGATRTTQFYYVIPLVSGLLAWIFLGEPVSVIQIQGGVIIFGGIMLSMISGSPSKRTPQGTQENTLPGTQPSPVSQQ